MRNKKIYLSYPGGCVIGKRPIDTHLYILKKLGIHIIQKNNCISGIAKNSLHGSDITLPEASVTATENLVIAACLIPGKTTIRLAACEPHVQDLCHFLNTMGAKIRGIGTHYLTIEGVKKLRGTKYSITPDYLETGTLAISAAITRSEVHIKHCDPHHLDIVWEKFEEIGVPFTYDAHSVTILPNNKKFKALPKLQTGVYPAFPTDLQAPFSVLLTQAYGMSKIFETLFEGRMGYFFELEKMGAKIEILSPNQTLIIGPTKLRSTPIASCDIRAGAAMVIAALAAEGMTEISNINYIDRGYEKLDEKLKSLGAEIERFHK